MTPKAIRPSDTRLGQSSQPMIHNQLQTNSGKHSNHLKSPNVWTRADRLPGALGPLSGCLKICRWSAYNYKQNEVPGLITLITLIRCPRHGSLIWSNWTEDQITCLIIIPLQRSYRRPTEAVGWSVGSRMSSIERCKALSYKWQDVGPAWSQKEEVSFQKHNRASSALPKEKSGARVSTEQPIKKASYRQLKGNQFDSHILSSLTFSSFLWHDQTDIWAIGIVLIGFSHSVVIWATVGPI